ncbi:MAG: hypothetical protein A3G18_04605 [Rhodospirillales bacterium RIFCSPLOWO2_12_FULL_58_28]|nr:MAG: hypothetical protein A3H92_09395 [Rhodospirillales bacterium RIFCSPLOWO2_02_FULL_58_16]OHC76923.1 MAG: hypothetical protein A3G18_04605 [Rhodospirillales bacterium RIFCSPLOWO2_12_FULL_58_28]
MKNADWDDLVNELDAWRKAGLVAAMWWRDDDACKITGALERLLDLSEEHETPLTLAVIPAEADPALPGLLASRPMISVVQHGYSHINHAPAGAEKSEFGPDCSPGRTHNMMLAELKEGHRLMGRFADSAPVLAPPWNRIDPALPASLPGIGIKGVSCYGPRASARPAPGLRCVNAHADLIAWRDGRRFTGAGEALSLIIGHLSARRAGLVDADEPTGLLTHHLDHDEDLWTFLGDFLHCVRDHPAVRLLSAREAFQ